MRAILPILFVMLFITGCAFYFQWRYKYHQENKPQQCDHKEFMKIFNGMLISKNKTIDSLKFVVKQKNFEIKQLKK